MASTYSNTGIELIGIGEQSNTWGQTTNTNWRLVEELATGVVEIGLTGLTSYSLTTTDGVTSNGRHLVIEFTGAPGATCTVTVSPSDMQKLYFINNATDQTVTITQGTGGDVDVPAGTKKIVYCDGAGAGAAVTDLTENLSLSGEVNVTTFSIDGTEVTATANELNILDGVTASAAELNILDGVTASTGELNILDGVTASTAEINKLDGLTASTEELNKTDGLTASTADLNTASTHYVPSGGIIMWSGAVSSIPTGWALCDGNNGTPDLRDRFVVGAGGSYSPDATGGADSVTLTEAQIPSHNHSMNSAGSHGHTGVTDVDSASGSFKSEKSGYSDSSGVFSRSGSQRCGDGLGGTFNNRINFNHTHSHVLSINANGDHTHTINNTGGGESHENRPPYYALAYIMKT